jgi:hypothetical protein
MRPGIVLAALCALAPLARAEVPEYDFRKPAHDGVVVVGMECHKKNGTLEVGIYAPSAGPLRRMDLWRVDDLIEVDPKTFFVLHTRRVERSCTLGADRYRVRFEGLPGAANAMWLCGAAMSASVTVWKNEREVLKEDFDNECRPDHGIRSAIFRGGSDTPAITRSPAQP